MSMIQDRHTNEDVHAIYANDIALHMTASINWLQHHINNTDRKPWVSAVPLMHAVAELAYVREGARAEIAGACAPWFDASAFDTPHKGIEP